MSNHTHDLENVLEDLGETASETDGDLSVGDAIDAFANRSFGALLTLIALVAALPLIGAIPGMSIVTGALIILVAGQFLYGRETPWTPESLRKLSIDSEMMEKAVDKAKPYAAFIDSFIRPRLTQLTDGKLMSRVIAVASIFLALIFFPMALIPGGVYLPALSVMALGLALLGRDGVLAIAGLLGAAASLALVFFAA